MRKNIVNKNSKGKYHGYQEWYWGNGNLWWRCNDINNLEDGYQELYWNNNKIRGLTFFIL